MGFLFCFFVVVCCLFVFWGVLWGVFLGGVLGFLSICEITMNMNVICTLKYFHCDYIFQINKTMADFSVANIGRPCLAETGSERSVRSTTATLTRGSKIHKCSLCGYQTNQLGNLRRHQRRHTGDFYRCHLCSSYFYDRYQLVMHLKGHAGALRCRVCDRIFTSQKGLGLHEKGHT